MLIQSNAIDPRPCLPERQCRLHEPELIGGAMFVRRVAGLPCPECGLAAKRPARFTLLQKRAPIAEHGPNGFGMKVTIEMAGRRDFEIGCLNGGRKLVWREIEPVPLVKK